MLTVGLGRFYSSALQTIRCWGDEQCQALKTVIDERNPRVIGIDRSTVFAFSDGLSSGELQGMSAARGEKWTSRFKNAEGLRSN